MDVRFNISKEIQEKLKKKATKRDLTIGGYIKYLCVEDIATNDKK